ncbi:MAG: carbohydrate ABC transporter, N-acetylglucosamine/diacetylchitobiose-binding protein, partial [Thermomicrobiaceae bacterium]|nr:carbohydrate ABC transporter, N-acetylglucosamine/diacetylchitobiose-binding protein [Thermomicrobiaceae bacterium]
TTPGAGGGAASPTSASGSGGYAPQTTAVITGNQASPVATLPTGEAANPLGVKPDQPLDVVIFKGGYGDEYAIHAEQIYAQAYPKAKVSHAGIQRLQEQLQPRFVAGNPPDVIDNSGAGNLDTAALVAEGQLADLADLMEAPSFDTPGKKFKETLIPGSQDTAVFDGKQYGLNYVYSVYGVWYNDALLKQKGWEYPQTWDAMLSLCEEIKKSGTAPWTYQGKYPQYMLFILHQMAYKAGGFDVIANLDNLAPNAWKQPEVKAAAEALYALADKGYIMEGTAGLTHTEAQAAWLNGKAVFIPCGSWLENEMKGLIPQGFTMVVKPTPRLSANDKLPFEAIQASAGETFIVPSKAKNVQGGKEFLRILFSKQGARFFAQNTKSLTVVLGSADGLELGSAFASVKEASEKAGNNTFIALYPTWYRKLYDEARNQLGAMLTKQIKPDEFLDKVQAMADQVAKDSSIKKYKR